MEKWLKLELEAAFPIYKKFQSISRHFAAGSYCYFKYGGSIRASFDSFASKRDKLHYIKLAKRIENTQCDPETFIAANFLDTGKCWVGKLNNQAASNTAVKFQGILDGAHTHLINDIREHLYDRLIDDEIKFSDMIKTDNPMVLPEFLQSVASKDISMHSVIILDRILGLRKIWDKQLEGNFVYESIASEIAKREGFYKFNTINTKTEFASWIKQYW